VYVEELRDSGAGHWGNLGRTQYSQVAPGVQLAEQLQGIGQGEEGGLFDVVVLWRDVTRPLGLEGNGRRRMPMTSCTRGFEASESSTVMPQTVRDGQPADIRGRYGDGCGHR
jgi:hypothetical protein